MSDTKQPLGPEPDRRFASRLAEHYQPEPLGPIERARFDATLRDRLAERRGQPAWLPSLLGTAVALALVWWSWPSASPQPQPVRSLANATTSWEADVLLVDADATLSEDEYLPDDYRVLAFAFIDDV